MIARCLAQVVSDSLLDVLATFGLIPVYAALVLHYYWVRRWDQAWRERWERKHGRSLDTLRDRIARSLKSVRLIPWVAGALAVIQVLTSLDVFLPAIKGEVLSNWQITYLCSQARLDVLFILLLPPAILSVKGVKYRLRKIDELL